MAGNDDGWLERLAHQGLDIVEFELLGPAFDALVLACRVVVQQGRLERIQRQCDDGWPAVVFAPFVGGAREHVELAAVIDDALVLDHPALGKHHQLAPVQDFAGEKGKQVGHGVGHHAD